MGVIVHILAAALALYIIADFCVEYSKATGSTWERMVAAGKGSATILWARFSMLVGALSDLAVNLADYLNMPQVSDTIKAALQPPYVAAFVVISAVVSEMARRRTL